MYCKRFPILKGPVERKLSEYKNKSLRGKIGEILWISLMTRPDLSYDVNVLSSQVTNATVATVN